MKSLDVTASAASHARDGDIAAAISSAIYWLTTIPQENVRISVRKGYVTLEGWLDALHQKQFLEQIVRQVSGVKDISNLIKIA